MATSQLRRCAENADEEIDVFTQQFYSSEDEGSVEGYSGEPNKTIIIDSETQKTEQQLPYKKCREGQQIISSESSPPDQGNIHPKQLPEPNSKASHVTSTGVKSESSYLDKDQCCRANDVVQENAIRIEHHQSPHSRPSQRLQTEKHSTRKEETNGSTNEGGDPGMIQCKEELPASLQHSEDTKTVCEPEVTLQDNRGRFTTRKILKKPTAFYAKSHVDNKRVDQKAEIEETVVPENAPYFQHERRLPEPNGEKELRRCFVFHADEEEKHDSNATKQIIKDNKERWGHDGFERLEAGFNPRSYRGSRQQHPRFNSHRNRRYGGRMKVMDYR